LPFSTDRFFAAIRDCYQEGWTDPDSNLGRLTYCLLGIVTPTELFRTIATPAFNIGRVIALHDFEADEAAGLTKGLGCEPALAHRLLGHVLYWTGGHPYLTQRLCQGVADGEVRSLAGVDRTCARLFFAPDSLEMDHNLAGVQRQILGRGNSSEVLSLYQ